MSTKWILGVTRLWPRPIFRNFLSGHIRTIPGNMHINDQIWTFDHLFAVYTKVQQIECACVGEIAVCNAVFHSTISRSIPEIFAIKSRSCLKSHRNFDVSGAAKVSGEGLRNFWPNLFYKPGSPSIMLHAKFGDDRPSGLRRIGDEKRKKKCKLQQQNMTTWSAMQHSCQGGHNHNNKRRLIGLIWTADTPAREVVKDYTPENKFRLRPRFSLYCCAGASVVCHKPKTHRRRRRDSAVELSRVGGVNAPVGSRDPSLQYPVELLRLVTSDDTMTSLLKKLSISIKIHVVKP